jgi:uncharacterized repeat protein (TIGR01451 family)
MCAAALACLLAATPALAGTTAASTFSKTGIDPATGSTATAGGAAGDTVAGHTINWVLSYGNTTGGLANVNITDPITGNQTYVPGSLQTPPGLAPQWSTNGGTSYGTTEPPTGVNAIGATGKNAATGTQVTAAPASGFNTGTPNGDGWEALFVGDNVYNIHHHASGAVTQVDCHAKSTGTECPGYPAAYVSPNAGDPLGTGPNTLITALTASGAVAGSKIYFPEGVIASTNSGIGCVDVATNKSCGYTKLLDAAVANSASVDYGTSGGTMIGTKYYVIGDQAQILCFDTATQAVCPGYAKTVTDSTYVANTALYAELSALESFGSGRYLFGNVVRPGNTRDLICVDTTTSAACPGFPKVAYGGSYSANPYNTVQAPILDASGNVTGICGEAAPNTTSHPFDCFDLAGNPVTTPWTQQIAGTNVNWVAFGSVVRIGSKLYFAESVNATGVATYTCWDFALPGLAGQTGAPCTAFKPASTGANLGAYTIRQDPYNPDCIWEVGNSGVFEEFSATFGGTTCNKSPAAMTVAPAASYCDGQPGHISGWNQIVLGGVTSSDYTGVSVSITDANGTPVPGWTNRVFLSTQQTIDISSIPITGSTATLHVSVQFGGLAAGKTATVTTTYKGDPIQVCFKTVAGTPKCAAAIPISDQANAVTIGVNNVSDSPAGNSSGTATLNEAADSSVCRSSIAVLKTAETSPGVPGTGETYDLKVTNNGPDAATNVNVSDPLPNALTYVSGSPGCTGAGRTVTCTLASLANGASQTFKVVTRIASSDTAAIDNTATATCADCGPPVTSSAHVPVGPKVDLGITKMASATTLSAGGQVMYTLVVQDHGPSDATGITVSDPAPAGLSIVSAHPSQGSCTTTASSVDCSLGGLANGGAAQILVTADVASTAVGSLANTAMVTGDQPDPDQSNNSSTATLNVTQPPVAQPVADLQVIKTVNHARARFGQPLIYTLKVKNLGPATATNAIVTDTSALPMHVESIKTTQGTCKVATPFTCMLGTVGVGRTVTITAKALPMRTGTELNSVSTIAPSRDPNAKNNVSAAKTMIRAYLLLTKTASARQISGGQDVTYALTVTNPTPAVIRNVTVCDQLPIGLTFVSSDRGSRLSNGSICWKVTRLGRHGSRTIRLTAAALPGASGNLVNLATATAAGVDPASASQAVSVSPAAPPATPVTG